MSYFQQYICSNCRKIHNQYYSEDTCQSCSNFLLAEYDLYRARQELDARTWARGSGARKYHHLLPGIVSPSLSLQEGTTPLISLDRSANRLQIKQLIVKDEAQNPGGSVRDREMSVLFNSLPVQNRSLVVVDGINGNALSASIYSARAQIASLILLPEQTPADIIAACQFFGATVKTIAWNPQNRSAVINSIPADKATVYDLNARGFTQRIEGSKTLFYELFDALDSMPDGIIVPVSEGITPLGIWKAMDELQKLGWLKGRQPKVYLVQRKASPWYTEGARRAEDKNNNSDETWRDFRSHITPLSGHVLKLALNQKWPLISVDEDAILDALKTIALEEGLMLSPAGAAAIAAIARILPRDESRRKLRFVVINPSSGMNSFRPQNPVME